jgi:hypothetical protein
MRRLCERNWQAKTPRAHPRQCNRRATRNACKRSVVVGSVSGLQDVFGVFACCVFVLNTDGRQGRR